MVIKTDRAGNPCRNTPSCEAQSQRSSTHGHDIMSGPLRPLIFMSPKSARYNEQNW